MAGKPWTADEDARLIELHASEICIKYADEIIPGRSGVALQARIAFLKLGRREIARQPWTADEDSLLRAEWATPGSIKSKLSLFPGRSWRALLVRAEKLGLGPREPKMRASTYSWVAEEIDRVLSQAPNLTVSEMSAASAASYERITQVLRSGHGALYYVSGWHQPRRSHGGSLAPRWSLGSGPDAPKPAARSRAQVVREYRLRKRVKSGRVNSFGFLVQQVSA